MAKPHPWATTGWRASARSVVARKIHEIMKSPEGFKSGSVLEVDSALHQHFVETAPKHDDEGTQTVYLVTTGEHADHQAHGVYASENAAQEVVERLRDESWSFPEYKPLPLRTEAD